ncbi:MAG TPA: hypothetical protein VJH96_04200 [Patescibacteria group bacterium]|nr:hypothetical protein [Patescibacteria group bacterium]
MNQERPNKQEQLNPNDNLSPLQNTLERHHRSNMRSRIILGATTLTAIAGLYAQDCAEDRQTIKPLTKIKENTEKILSSVGEDQTTKDPTQKRSLHQKSDEIIQKTTEIKTDTGVIREDTAEMRPLVKDTNTRVKKIEKKVDECCPDEKKPAEVKKQEPVSQPIVEQPWTVTPPPPEKKEEKKEAAPLVDINLSINIQKIQPKPPIREELPKVKEEVTPRIQEHVVTIFEEAPDFLQDIPEDWRWVFDADGLAPNHYQIFETAEASHLNVPNKGIGFFSLGKGEITIQGIKQKIMIKGEEGTVTHVILLGSKSQNTDTHIIWHDPGANVEAHRNFTTRDKTAGLTSRSVSATWYSEQIVQAGESPNGGGKGEGADYIDLHIIDLEPMVRASGKMHNPYLTVRIPTGKRK